MKGAGLEWGLFQHPENQTLETMKQQTEVAAGKTLKL